MKKSILMLAAGALLLATPSCKKGENDPFMSLSSRTSRLSGTWNLTAASWTETDVFEFGGDNYTSKTVYTYDGTNLKYVESLTGPAGTTTDPEESFTFANSMTFDKDGSYSSSMTADGETSTEEGFWYFAGKSKVQELKKKEAVVISLTKEVDAGDTYTYTGTALNPDNMLMLDQLSGKEMIVKLDSKTTYPDGDNYESVGTWTFEKK